MNVYALLSTSHKAIQGRAHRIWRHGIDHRRQCGYFHEKPERRRHGRNEFSMRLCSRNGPSRRKARPGE